MTYADNKSNQGGGTMNTTDRNQGNQRHYPGDGHNHGDPPGGSEDTKQDDNNSNK